MPVSETPQNIVVIMSDQHNPQYLGCAGHPLVETPNIDRLAGRGVQFNQAYSPCPLCVPARMSFMTGKYAHRLGIWTNGGILPSVEPTFAHGLGSAGYEAVLSGKMHFKGPDQFHGFEKRLTGDPYGHTLFNPELYTNEEGEAWTANTPYAVRASGPGKQGFQYYDHVATDKACDFIRERAQNPGERPYCLVVGLICPHNPYVCEKDLFAYYLERIEAYDEADMETMDQAHPDLEERRKRMGLDKLTREEQRRARAAYLGLVTEIDRNVGQILDTLEEAGIREDTIVVYTSDHGDMAGEGGLWFKNTFMDGSARIPLIVDDPSDNNTGRVIDQNVNLIDLPATILAWAQAPALPDADARSLQPLLQNTDTTADWRDETYSEIYDESPEAPMLMLRQGQWKFNYFYGQGSCQLFDMRNDPHERRNLACEPAYADRVRLLQQRVEELWSGEQVRRDYQRGTKRQQYVNSSGHEWFPHTPPTVEAPPEWQVVEFQ